MANTVNALLSSLCFNEQSNEKYKENRVRSFNVGSRYTNISYIGEGTYGLVM